LKVELFLTQRRGDAEVLLGGGMTAAGQVTLAPDLTFKLCGSRGHPSKLRAFAPSREIK